MPKLMPQKISSSNRIRTYNDGLEDRSVIQLHHRAIVEIESESALEDTQGYLKLLSSQSHYI